MELSNKIRKLRRTKGYTQSFVAGELEISQRAYSKIELNETQLSWKRINQLAEILNIDVIELTGVTNECDQAKNNLNENINLLENLIQQYESKIEALETEIKELKKHKMVLS